MVTGFPWLSRYNGHVKAWFVSDVTTRVSSGYERARRKAVAAGYVKVLNNP